MNYKFIKYGSNVNEGRQTKINTWLSSLGEEESKMIEEILEDNYDKAYEDGYDMGYEANDSSLP